MGRRRKSNSTCISERRTEPYQQLLLYFTAKILQTVHVSARHLCDKPLYNQVGHAATLRRRWQFFFQCVTALHPYNSRKNRPPHPRLSPQTATSVRLIFRKRFGNFFESQSFFPPPLSPLRRLYFARYLSPSDSCISASVHRTALS